tara:strand:- start:306 stop:545 length:240 start_codon:yes stop_codon:yes gene_type:complete
MGVVTTADGMIEEVKTEIMNKIILTRGDLVKFKSGLEIGEISIHDFKSSSISRDGIHKAGWITFEDGGLVKELKKRYGI